MMMPSMRRAAFIAAVLVWAPAMALAQTAQAPAPAAAPASKDTAGSAAQARVDAHIKRLHAQLKITSAEAAQWNQFAEVMRTNAREMDEAAAQRAEKFSSMNALQDMQSYEQLAEGHVQHLQKLIPAFEALYNAMPKEQQQLADRVFRAGAERHAQAGGEKK
jgi:periplasmic protein CpxP/Spy